MPKDTNIANILGKMRLNKSVSLSDDKKATMLRAVFNSAGSHVAIPRYTTRVASPFTILFSRYVLPVFVLFFVGTQYGDILAQQMKLALGQFNAVKSDVQSAQKTAELKTSLSLNHKDILALKQVAAQESADVGVSSNTSLDKTQLIASVTTRSREIRNQVASLVKENKITEAKQIVLTLETALKADELYKVATSVSDSVFETTDLRLDIERKETESTTTAAELATRIENSKKLISKLEDEENASTTSVLAEAKTHLTKSEEYMQKGDIENAIISLQAHDRIVAEVQLILLP